MVEPKPTNVVLTDEDAGTPATKAHVNMIITHLGKTDYAWAETTKALLIEAVDKCSNIESAKADKRKFMDVVNENGIKRVDRTTWNGGFAKGQKHGLCFYDICCDCKNQCAHDQRETKSWFVYNNGKLVWQEYSIVSVPKFAIATAVAKPPTAVAQPSAAVVMPDIPTMEYHYPQKTATKDDLILAAENGQTEIVRKLIDAGADLNYQNGNEFTALVMATWHGHTEIARLLIDAGTNVDVKDKHEQCALIHSTGFNFPEIVKSLINAGAKLDQLDGFKSSALYYA